MNMKDYEIPTVEVIEVAVEKGYAESDGIGYGGEADGGIPAE